MESKKIDFGIKEILFILLAVFALMLWFLEIGVYLHDFHYRYPVIPNFWRFTYLTLANILLPFALLVASVIFFFKKKRSTATILLVLFFPVWLFCNFRVLYEVLGYPTVCSYTVDKENFGCYDECVEGVGALQDYFPQNIPENAENVQYCYYYTEASATYVYIAVSWEYADRWAFEEEMERVWESAQTVRTNKGNVISCYNDYDGWNPLIVISNEREQKIAYVLATDARGLPQNLDEVMTVKWWDYHFSS